MSRNRADEAAVTVAAGLAEFPNSIALLHMDALIDVQTGRFELARGKPLGLLERSALLPEFREAVLNDLAWTAVMLNDAENLREAEEIARVLVKQRPLPNVRGTYGAVLVLRRKPDRAMRHLRFALDRCDTDSSGAHAAAWLGAAQAALGRFRDADAWLSTAEALDPECASLPRARRLLRRRRQRRH